MSLPSDQLVDVGERFLSSLNARDFGSASDLYAADAIYCSSALASAEYSEGRIEGRDQIMAFFRSALEDDDEFVLSKLDVFAGLDLAVVVSSMGGRVFIDVLRTDHTGLIVEHSEVAPKASPIDFLTGQADGQRPDD